MRIKATIVAYALSVQCFENATIVAYAGLRLMASLKNKTKIEKINENKNYAQQDSDHLS